MTQLDPKTFGETPAAMYLVRLLNERGDKGLTRRISRTVHQYNEHTAELVNSPMKPGTVANCLRMLRQEATIIRTGDSFLDQLVRNVVIGRIKRGIREYSVLCRVDRFQNQDDEQIMRKTMPAVYNHPIFGIVDGFETRMLGDVQVAIRDVDTNEVFRKAGEVKDETTAELLHQRSLARCKRQGKAWAQ